MKSNKGITLVALVITIIVLLILAGVSISLVVGDNGVLTRATDSSKKTAYAQEKEDVQMALTSAQGEFIGEWNTNTAAEFETWLNAARFTSNYKGKNGAQYDPDKKTITVTVNGEECTAILTFTKYGCTASYSGAWAN